MTRIFNRDVCRGVLLVRGFFLLGYSTPLAFAECDNIRLVDADHPLHLVGQPGETIHLELYHGFSERGGWSSSDGVYIEASDAEKEFMTTIKVLPPTRVEREFGGSNYFTVQSSFRVPEVPGQGIYYLSGALRGDLNFAY